MNFCPNCGKMLKIVKNNLPVLQCTKCGYKDQTEYSETNKPPKSRIANGEHKTIGIVDEKEVSKLRTLPTIKSVCSKCGGDESETWSIVVGSEGASSTLTFFKCTSCGYTRREIG